MKVKTDPEMTLNCDPHPNQERPCNSSEPDDIDLTDVREQRGVILSILTDFLQPESIGQLRSWIAHVGFDVRSIRYPADLPTAWLAHYRKGRGYDYQRALNDLVTWPPIAREIAMPAENECDAECKIDYRLLASE